ALFDTAMARLVELQSITLPDDFPAYDGELLLRELRLFDEWFLGAHLGIELDEGERAQLQTVYRVLVDAALAQPQVLVHRDYMPRNLMPCGDDVAMLDFQDAVRGPIAYDPACLFKDAFLSWPETRVANWHGRYHALATRAGLPVPPLERFRRDLDLIGVHRHLKVMGIFARLKHRDGKPKYVADAPRFLAYLDAVLPRHAQLRPLAEPIDARGRPPMDAAVSARPPPRAHEGAGLRGRPRRAHASADRRHPQAAAARRRQAADRLAPRTAGGDRRARGRGQHLVAGRAVPGRARRRLRLRPAHRVLA